MRFCGVDLSGSTLAMAIVEKTGDECSWFDAKPAKLTLNNDADAGELKQFFATFAAFVREHQIERIGIKQRAAKGRFAGGSTTFKIEGLVQLIEVPSITLIAANRIAKQSKGLEMPAGLRAYQHDAYRTAYTMAIA